MERTLGGIGDRPFMGITTAKAMRLAGQQNCGREVRPAYMSLSEPLSEGAAAERRMSDEERHVTLR